MNSGEDGADAALEIIRQWAWLRCDPDGVPFHPGKNLSEVVNRLAMEGQIRPQNAVLSLLCRGDLEARGFYRWRKYQFGSFFQFEESGASIGKKKWQTLADLIADQQRRMAENEWPWLYVDLEKLELPDCLIVEWEFDHDRFSTALCPPDTPKEDGTYFEELFSAWEIEVWPPIVSDDPPDDEPELITRNANKGGRPPAADWEAAALEMAGRYYCGDFKPATIADVSRELASWLADQDAHPSDSVLRTHAKRIFEAFQAWERDCLKP